MTDVSIYRSISKVDQGLPNEPVSAEELKAFIDKYGVDFRDKKRRYLLEFAYTLPEAHIDLIMSYKPNFVIDDRRVVYFGCFGRCSAYVLQKVLEMDHDFLYVTRHAHPILNTKKGEIITYLDFLRKLSTMDCYATSSGFVVGNKMIVLLENHEKRYYRLFDLLLKFIEKNGYKRRCRHP